MSGNLLHLDPFAAALARKEREEQEAREAANSQPPESSQPEKPAATGQKSWQPSESSQPPETHPGESAKNSQPRNSSQPSRDRLDLLAALPDVKGHAEIPYQVIDHLFRYLPPPQQAIYTQLYRLSWGWGRERCFISNPKLAERACLSVSAVKDNVNKMVTKGLIEKTGNTLGFGKDQGIEYLVRAPSWQLARSSQLHQSRQPRESRQPGSGPIKEEQKENIKGGGAISCPDCQGTGFYYPGGTGQGVARCAHRKLRAEISE